MKKIHISQIDTLFSNGSYPIEFLLFYKNFPESKLIRESISGLAEVFWPVFGKFNSGSIYFENYDEDSRIIENQTREDFNPEIILAQSITEYNKHDPEDDKLFFMKIIHFADGTAILPKLKHIAGDGFSYFYFLSALAQDSKNRIYPGKENPDLIVYLPKHNRTCLKEFSSGSIPAGKKIIYDNLHCEFQFVLKSEIKESIKAVLRDSGERISTNDILCGIILKKYASIRENSDPGTFTLTMPIDVRTQIHEYGPDYFGNPLMLHDIIFDIKEIEELTPPELAIRIRKSMPEITKDNYLRYLSRIEKLIESGQYDKLLPYNPDKGCLITNLSVLPASRLDFGTGIPDFVSPLTVGKNSTVILSDKQKFILKYIF